MTRQLLHYLRVLRRFTHLCAAQRTRYLLHPHRDFIRRSTLSFQRTVTLILGLMRKSTTIELADSFLTWGSLPITKSAFSQRRKLIHPQFFQDFFQLSVTQFNRKRFHYRRMCELYTKRWGVETAFFILKSFLQLAVVSAYTQPGVEQDLWASFWFYNLNSAWEFAQHQSIKERTQHRLYTYQLNWNMAAGLIKRWVASLFLDATRKWRATTTVLQKLLLMHLEPKRRRPSRTRTRKFLRTQGRHIYEPVLTFIVRE